MGSEIGLPPHSSFKLIQGGLVYVLCMQVCRCWSTCTFLCVCRVGALYWVCLLSCVGYSLHFLVSCPSSVPGPCEILSMTPLFWASLPIPPASPTSTLFHRGNEAARLGSWQPWVSRPWTRGPHSPLDAVGSSHHPAGVNEGPSTHVLILYSEAHLPGPMAGHVQILRPPGFPTSFRDKHVRETQCTHR